MRIRLKRGALARARQLRGAQTDMERLLWWKLRDLNARGYHFRRQVPMHGYIVDFAEHGGRVAIELDGGQHGFVKNIARDKRRDAAIRAEGYLVLRFWNNDVRTNLDGVVEAIIREINLRRPPTRNLQKANFDLPTRGR